MLTVNNGNKTRSGLFFWLFCQTYWGWRLITRGAHINPKFYQARSYIKILILQGSNSVPRRHNQRWKRSLSRFCGTRYFGIAHGSGQVLRRNFAHARHVWSGRRCHMGHIPNAVWKAPKPGFVYPDTGGQSIGTNSTRIQSFVCRVVSMDTRWQDFFGKKHCHKAITGCGFTKVKLVDLWNLRRLSI